MSHRIDTFRTLHASGCFVIPNPWDVGSAGVLARLGFKALATTSAGFAWSIGRPDNKVSVDDVLSHLRTIASAVDLPVNADFEGAFAQDPDGVAANVARAAATGIAGLSVEDSSGSPDGGLFEFELAVDRIRAARQALDDSGTGVLLTARSEGFIRGRPDLPETIRRLTAYADAGADCLYAPGIRTNEQISAIVQAVAPKPVNVLAVADSMTVDGLAALGVRRVSVGGSLARTAWTGFLRAAKEIAERGTFTGFAGIVAVPEMNRLFAEE